MLTNKTILITGGTGTFGKNFAKYILENHSPKKLIIFSRDEFKQFKMAEEITDDRLRFFIGDVRDLPRLQRAFREVDIVIHAAALKQIPTVEYNPSEAIKTNIIGSQNVIEAALDQKVSKVLLVSTDKAAYPVNLYGASKLCAEKLFISGNFFSASKTIFSAVRYGNVLGSRGSIVESLMQKGKTENISITHPEMTRFWITLDQCYRLVTYAIDNMAGGEIFIPKVPSMKLVDLVSAMAPGVKTKVSGIRPGEKIHEVLVTAEEAGHTVEVGGYYIILPQTKMPLPEKISRKYGKNGKKLPSGFQFASHTNKAWLTSTSLNAIIQKIKVS